MFWLWRTLPMVYCVCRLIQTQTVAWECLAWACTPQRGIWEKSFLNMAPCRMSRLCMTSSRGDPGALLSFTLRTKMMLKRYENMSWQRLLLNLLSDCFLGLWRSFICLFTVRQKNEPTAWSWTDEGSGWTSPSQKDLTPQPLESTWAGPRSKLIYNVWSLCVCVCVWFVVTFFDSTYHGLERSSFKPYRTTRSNCFCPLGANIALSYSESKFLNKLPKFDSLIQSIVDLLGTWTTTSSILFQGIGSLLLGVT